MTKTEKKVKTTVNQHEMDATDKIFGRFASEVALLLRGKHKVSWRPNKDVGDSVVIRNLDKLKFSGNKLTTKIKHRHSGYPGGIKSEKLGTLWKKNPKNVFYHTVRGMLPKNKLAKIWLKRLKIK